MEPLLTIATGVASKAVTTALEPLIRELIAAQEAQNAQLEQLRQEIRRLIDGPWRLSMLHLRAAESAGPADRARRSAELEKAADALLQAYSLHPDASVSRALIAADLSMVEGLIGRQKDAAGWANTAHDDITTFLQQQATQVQQKLNGRPPLLQRVRNTWDIGFWTDVLGGLRNVPASVTESPDKTAPAIVARSAASMRELLERGPDAEPGWYPLAESTPTRAGENDVSTWIPRWNDPKFSAMITFSPGSLPHVRALIELHAAASRAETLRQVCAQFGQRKPAYHLVVRLQRRYGAEVSYRPG